MRDSKSKMKIDEIANSQEYIAIQLSPENGKKLTYLSTRFRQFRTKNLSEKPKVTYIVTDQINSVRLWISNEMHRIGLNCRKKGLVLTSL